MVPSLPLLSCESSVSVKENPERKEKKKFMKEFTKLGARYSATCDLQSQSNIDNYFPELLEHHHEEADTLLMLQEMTLLLNVTFIHRIQMSWCYLYITTRCYHR